MRKLLCLPFLSFLLMGCGTFLDPREREIMDTTYWLIDVWYKDYPELRADIDWALTDDKITLGEFVKISTLQEELENAPTMKDRLKETVKNANR